jgi:hypothetical protein
MMKTAWAWMMAGVLLVSCERDEPHPAEPALRLVPEEMQEVDFSKKFIYNASGQLAQIKMVSRFPGGGSIESEQNFFYDAQGILKESTTDTGWRITYTFSNGLITRADEFVNGAASQYHTYRYNPQGRLLESITWQDIPEEGGEIPVAKTTYEYDANNNVIQQQLYYFTSFGAEAKLSTTFLMSDYDDKINSEGFFDIHPANPLVQLSTNNPGKMEIRNQNGFTFSRETFEYDYHADGYPTGKTTHTLLYNGNEGTYKTTYRFKE